MVLAAPARPGRRGQIRNGERNELAVLSRGRMHAGGAKAGKKSPLTATAIKPAGLSGSKWDTDVRKMNCSLLYGE